MKEDSRGVVISMAGSLLFPTGKGELSPIARRNLDQVATALEAQDQSAQFAIEGHTDDSGSAALNEQLSEKRAEAVADYLNERGIAEGRMRVAGFGERMPVAANDTEEGQRRQPPRRHRRQQGRGQVVARDTRGLPISRAARSGARDGPAAHVPGSARGVAGGMRN